MCLEMMSSWCRQVNWGNCGIPWVNCAVLCVKDDWKYSSEAFAIACQNCAFYSAFPLGMTSHSHIAQLNWECIGHFTYVVGAGISLQITIVTELRNGCLRMDFRKLRDTIRGHRLQTDPDTIRQPVWHIPVLLAWCYSGRIPSSSFTSQECREPYRRSPIRIHGSVPN